MKIKQIPGTQLFASEICLGGGYHALKVSEEESERIVDAYRERGGNFIDTANIYGKWKKEEGGIPKSELFLGKYIRDRECRHRIVLDTKGGSPFFETMNTPRLSEADVRSDLEDSLKNLQTDYIDLYWLHHDDPSRPVEEILWMMERFVQEGKIRYYGCSNWSLQRIEEAAALAEKHGWHGFAANQMLGSYARCNEAGRAMEQMEGLTPELYRYHASHNLAMMPYGSQARGYFEHIMRPDFEENPRYENCRLLFDNPISRSRALKARKIAECSGCTPTQVALSFLLNIPDFPVFPMIGPRDEKQLLESMDAASLSFSKEMYHYLRDDDIL